MIRSDTSISDQKLHTYCIRVEGHLAADWSEWFDGMTILHEAGGETLIVGPVRDQAALHGLLAKVRDLCLTLVAVNRVESAGSDERSAL